MPNLIIIIFDNDTIYYNLKKKHESAYCNVEQFALTLMQAFAKLVHLHPSETFDVLPISYREYSFSATEAEFSEMQWAIFAQLRAVEKRSSVDNAEKQLYQVNIVTYKP